MTDHGHAFPPLDLLRPCPACGNELISEHVRRCAQCEAFANRRRECNDADWGEAVRDGLIVPKTGEAGP